MARSAFLSVIVAAIVFSASSPAWAMDVYGDQIWFRGLERSTVQHWQFTTSTNADIVPETYKNPYGTPLANMTGADWEWDDDWPAPPGLEPGDGVPGWHSPVGGTTIYMLHNDPQPNAQKILIAQVTASKEPLSVSLELPEGFSYSMFDTGFATVEWGLPAPFDGFWRTYVYGFNIVGNPEWECVQIDHPPCSTLDRS